MTAQKARAIYNKAPKTRLEHIFKKIKSASESNKNYIEVEDIEEDIITTLNKNGFKITREWAFTPKHIYTIQW